MVLSVISVVFFFVIRWLSFSVHCHCCWYLMVVIVIVLVQFFFSFRGKWWIIIVDSLSISITKRCFFSWLTKWVRGIRDYSHRYNIISIVEYFMIFVGNFKFSLKLNYTTLEFDRRVISERSSTSTGISAQLHGKFFIFLFVLDTYEHSFGTLQWPCCSLHPGKQRAKQKKIKRKRAFG